MTQGFFDHIPWVTPFLQLLLKGLPNDVMGQAYYLQGKSLLESGDNVNAEKSFKEVGALAPNTTYAAEASFQLCYIKFLTKPSKQVETTILKHINDYDAFPDWSAEGWLLLADNHLALKDTAKAIIVLNWYIENGESQVHVKRAQDKIGMIDAAQHKVPERKQEELILPLGDPNDQKLFENGNGGGQ